MTILSPVGMGNNAAGAGFVDKDIKPTSSGNSLR